VRLIEPAAAHSFVQLHEKENAMMRRLVPVSSEYSVFSNLPTVANPSRRTHMQILSNRSDTDVNEQPLASVPWAAKTAGLTLIMTTVSTLYFFANAWGVGFTALLIAMIVGANGVPAPDPADAAIARRSNRSALALLGLGGAAALGVYAVGGPLFTAANLFIGSLALSEIVRQGMRLWLYSRR
jgi:hypothetical protein